MASKIKRDTDLWDCEKAPKTVTTSALPVHIRLFQIDRKFPMNNLRVVPIISALSQARTGNCGWNKNMPTRNPLIDLAMKICPGTEQSRYKSTTIEKLKVSSANLLGILRISARQCRDIDDLRYRSKVKRQSYCIIHKIKKVELIREFVKLAQKYLDTGTPTTIFSTSAPISLSSFFKRETYIRTD